MNFISPETVKIKKIQIYISDGTPKQELLLFSGGRPGQGIGVMKLMNSNAVSGDASIFSYDIMLKTHRILPCVSLMLTLSKHPYLLIWKEVLM